MSLEEDYKRDYAEFGGSFEEYKAMIRTGKIIKWIFITSLMLFIAGVVLL